MKKPRHFIGRSSFHKDFGDLFVRLAERHGRHEVWSDFITMSACALSNAGDKRFFQEREEMYLALVKPYTKDEADILAQMLGYVIMALEENPEQDFLGEMFSGLNLHNEWKGQFFTPYPQQMLEALLVKSKVLTENQSEDNLRQCIKILEQFLHQGLKFKEVERYSKLVLENLHDSRLANSIAELLKQFE
jgi:hypothetical protein